MKPSPFHPVNLVLGLIIWALWFVLLYGGLSVACAFAPPDAEAGAWTWVNAASLILAFIVAGYLLACAYGCWKASSPPHIAGAEAVNPFISKISASVYLVSAFASLMLTMPGVFLPPCV
ncbi:hypothetical protein ATG98_2511 [Marinobacter sp. LV10R520-4]|uniref:hypothetical protein n=1 Tax=Marinobacter sp. LV10R520-4 TaxID=1761796 RepID=UPI000BF3BAD8|nr:hypothetical protein [Marinobacter sp. LV10R520-4]PFG53404.1 hypothetical protein ATG98_2511 [Marinobacter sp. LV10R520-4]